MGEKLLTQMDQSSIVNQDCKLAIQLYGHPLVALDFISRDLDRYRLNEWQPSYKREPKHLVMVVRELKDKVLYHHTIEAPGEVLIQAARDKQAIRVEIPKVDDTPPASTPVEQAYRDWLNRTIQVKDGRWRNHYRGTSWSWRRGHRATWIKTLCDYDKDPELRKRYPLGPTNSYPPENFIKDAEKWRDDYIKPQIEANNRARLAAFGEIDKRVKEFCSYCQSIGAKDIWWHSESDYEASL